MRATRLLAQWRVDFPFSRPILPHYHAKRRSAVRNGRPPGSAPTISVSERRFELEAHAIVVVETRPAPAPFPNVFTQRTSLETRIASLGRTCVRASSHCSQEE